MQDREERVGHALREDLLAERPLARRRQGQVWQEPAKHLLEELRDAREHAQLAL